MPHFALVAALELIRLSHPALAPRESMPLPPHDIFAPAPPNYTPPSRLPTIIVPTRRQQS